MSKKRKTELEETVLEAMGPDMQEETSNGKGEDEAEDEKEETS